jgi:hypothetical protein
MDYSGHTVALGTIVIAHRNINQYWGFMMGQLSGNLVLKSLSGLGVEPCSIKCTKRTFLKKSKVIRGFKMKTQGGVLLAAVLMSGVMGAQAFDGSRGDTQECKSQLAKVYGNANDMYYVGERRYMDGTEVKYAVRNTDAATGYSTTRLAVCWLGAENYQAYSGSDEDTMLADVDASAPQALEEPIAK